MAWRNRLRELLLAGGALAIAGCSSSLPGDGNAGTAGSLATPCGNANPDPCICGRPDASAVSAMLCDQRIACEAEGGKWDFYMTTLADGTSTPPHCNPPDGGVD